jgi:hypothetical protein
MSGYYNDVRSDACNRNFEDMTNQYINDYVMKLSANYRTHLDQAFPLSQGLQPSFWGPLRGRRVTQDSFLQGRGQTLADCPECDVKWLPESLFPESTSKLGQTMCQRTDLQPLYTKQPQSCNGLSETDVTQFWFSPSNYQKGYSGYRSVVETNLQTRQPPWNPSQNNGGESYGCAQNYGTFGSTWDLKPYSL